MHRRARRHTQNERRATLGRRGDGSVGRASDDSIGSLDWGSAVCGRNPSKKTHCWRSVERESASRSPNSAYGSTSTSAPTTASCGDHASAAARAVARMSHHRRRRHAPRVGRQGRRGSSRRGGAERRRVLLSLPRHCWRRRRVLISLPASRFGGVARVSSSLPNQCKMNECELGRWSRSGVCSFRSNSNSNSNSKPARDLA